jgi:ribosomal protein S21
MRGRKIIVGPDGNVERALRKFKKKMMENGILQEVRDRQEFVKPTTERKIARNKAKSRWKKYLRDQQLPPKMY